MRAVVEDAKSCLFECGYCPEVVDARDFRHGPFRSCHFDYAAIAIPGQLFSRLDIVPDRRTNIFECLLLGCAL